MIVGSPVGLRLHVGTLPLILDCRLRCVSVLLLRLQAFWHLGYICVLSGTVPAPRMLLVICRPILGCLPLIRAVRRLIVCGPAGVCFMLPGFVFSVLHFQGQISVSWSISALVSFSFSFLFSFLSHILLEIIKRNMLLPILWMLSAGFRTKVAFPLLFQKTIRFVA